MIREFREFIMRGNVLDLAVGIIIGAAFGAIVNSLVNDVIMPPIGFLLSGVDFSSIAITLGTTTAADGTTTEVVIRIGAFINAVINFLIVALVIFLIVKAFNEAKRRAERPAPAVPAAPPEPTAEEKLTAAINQLNETIRTKM
jgi:large conductance mechanosensitive channel